MPRLSPQLIRHAASIDRHLPFLLRECRDLQSARNELRWIKEAIAAQPPPPPSTRGLASGRKACEPFHEKALTHAVRRRARGEPLQYILGTQPFGDLEIMCAPGVLIPRCETETYTLQLAGVVREGAGWLKDARNVSIVDFCTGSGCIALLLHSILKPPHQDLVPFKQVNVGAFDISPAALDLTLDNIRHNLELRTLHENARNEIHVKYLDVLKLAQQTHEIIMGTIVERTGSNQIDIIISNPPYISPAKYKPGGDTARSVRNFEPKLALVPPDMIRFAGVDQADQFYVALLKIATVAKAKILVMEVGDMEQAVRVRELCAANGDVHVEIWRDDSTIVHGCSSQLDSNPPGNDEVEARVVVVWFDPDWAEQRQKDLRKARNE